MIINFSKLEEFEQFEAPPVFNKVSFKNFKIKKAFDYIDEYTKEIILCMESHILNRKKYQYVDVKVQHLTKGQNTANGFWHLDSSLNYGPYYENYLFVIGDNRTEFIDGEIDIPIVNNSKEFSDKIEQFQKPIFTIKNKTITRFFGDNVHRGVICKKDETRLLTRLINTDNKLPSYRI